MQHSLRTSIAATLLAASIGCGPTAGADLVVIGGVVHTSDPDFPVARAFAVSDGRFVAVGDDDEIRSHIGDNTTVIELESTTVIPGLIDGHVHLGSGISLVRGVNLYGMADKQEWLDMIAAKATELPEGDWIVGGLWDHTLLRNAELPTKEDLDAVAPNHPVALSDVDGHSMWANSLALQLGGITAAAPLDPLEQLYAAVLREKPGGGPEGGWYPEQRLSFEEALFAYTQAPADAAGWGDEVGSISVGKRADFVVLDAPLSLPLDRGILQRSVQATYLNGMPVFTRN